MGGVKQEEAEIEESSSTAEIPKKIKVCEGCKQNPSKYECPGCSLRSCSLPCVKAHKQHTGCTGKRKQTQFVSLSQFDDNLLLSDYNLLEEMKRVAESAQRMRVKKKSITWTIEWRFHSTKMLDHGVHENTKLGSVIEKHLKPGPWNHPLKRFCEEQLDCLRFFICKYPKGPRSPFRELDIRAPIGQLSNLVILEYPIIHVLPEHSCDFEIAKDVKPVPCEPEPKNTDLNVDGVHFKEEEIEDEDDSLETKVLDMLKRPVKERSSFQDSQRHDSPVAVADIDTPKPMFEVAQGRESVAEGDGLIHNAENDGPFFSSNIDEMFNFNDLDFKFEQELIDAYSDLIAESDGFLNLDGAFYKETGLEGGRWDSNVILPSEEELEEGEIAS